MGREPPFPVFVHDTLFLSLSLSIYLPLCLSLSIYPSLSLFLSLCLSISLPPYIIRYIFFSSDNKYFSIPSHVQASIHIHVYKTCSGISMPQTQMEFKQAPVLQMSWRRRSLGHHRTIPGRTLGRAPCRRIKRQREGPLNQEVFTSNA
jgi:hypothetical protein